MEKKRRAPYQELLKLWRSGCRAVTLGLRHRRNSRGRLDYLYDESTLLQRFKTFYGYLAKRWLTVPTIEEQARELGIRWRRMGALHICQNHELTKRIYAFDYDLTDPDFLYYAGKRGQWGTLGANVYHIMLLSDNYYTPAQNGCHRARRGSLQDVWQLYRLYLDTTEDDWPVWQAIAEQNGWEPTPAEELSRQLAEEAAEVAMIGKRVREAILAITARGDYQLTTTRRAA